MWEWYWDTRNMCLVFTIPILIIAIGLLVSWWKGQRSRVQAAALGATLAGAAFLTFVALVPFGKYVVSGLPPVWCLAAFVPFLVLASVGIAVALRFDKQNRTGVVEAEKRAGLLVCGVAFLLVASVGLGGVLFIPYGTESFAYHVSVTPGPDGNYTAYLPAPLGGDGLISEWARHIKVEKGSAAFSFNDTDHGKALVVSASGPVTLGMSATLAYFRAGDNTLGDVHLSLVQNLTGNRRPIFVGLDPDSQVDNITVNLSMKGSHDSTFDGGHYFTCRGASTVEKGWHEMVTRWGGVYYD